MLFLTLIVVGIVGLAVMALPALAHGGHLGSAGGGHALPSAHHGPQAGHGGAEPSGTALFGAMQFLLSPRAIFSVLAIYGAIGNALVRAGHLTTPLAAAIAVVPALVVERFVVSPLWNLMFRYQGKPSSPLYELILSEAKAVTPFKNGRGIVAVEHDGRSVQFVARLSDAQRALRVRVGERLRVDEVDGRPEGLVVSIAAASQGASVGGRSSPPNSVR